MREHGREPGYESPPTTPVGAETPASREGSTPDYSRGSLDSRIRGLRARLQAGEYEVPAMLVAERIIARALAAPRELPPPPGAISRPDAAETPSEAA